MRIFYELSWLWKSLAILIGISAAAVLCLFGIFRLFRKRPGKLLTAAVVIAAILAAGAVICRLAQTPMMI